VFCSVLQEWLDGFAEPAAPGKAAPCGMGRGRWMIGIAGTAGGPATRARRWVLICVRSCCWWPRYCFSEDAAAGDLFIAHCGMPQKITQLTTALQCKVRACPAVRTLLHNGIAGQQNEKVSKSGYILRDGRTEI